MSAAIKLNSYPSVKLVVQKGPHQGQRFSFSKNKINIGRSPENDIILVNDPLISRNHACIQFTENEIEIVNISDKNSILINKENVQRWKLNHNSVFTLGDTEFILQIENQQSVVSVTPPLAAVKSSPVGSAIAPKKPVQMQPASQAQVKQFKPAPVTPRTQFQSKPFPNQVNRPIVRNDNHNILNHPKARFYLVLFVVLTGALFFYFQMSPAESKKNKKTILTYADEVGLKLKSKANQDAIKKLEGDSTKRQSASFLRAEEYFNKGIRAFHLGKYSNAIESFQQVQMLNSEHQLAKRYLRLSIIRFDEVVKAKLELGQSYFESNNFKLCASMNKQVIEMLKFKEVLQGPTKDTNLQLAESMMKKCEFAAEGIR
jgi:pSer/pThr/pTyr-binding forkhead associated (FHA) protein